MQQQRYDVQLFSPCVLRRTGARLRVDVVHAFHRMVALIPIFIIQLSAGYEYTKSSVDIRLAHNDDVKEVATWQLSANFQLAFVYLALKPHFYVDFLITAHRRCFYKCTTDMICI